MGLFDNFPYTNFHELNQDWIIKTIKDLLAEWAETSQALETWRQNTQASLDSWRTDAQATIDKYTAIVVEFRDFVTNYFDNLDVQQEINNKLDAMADSGELYKLMLPFMQAETAEQNNRITVLESRMDKFSSLPSGSLSTDADAELVDVRIGYTGKTYPNAGDAVRGQIRSIANALEETYTELPTTKYERQNVSGSVNNPIVISQQSSGNFNYSVSQVTPGMTLYCHFYPVGQQTFGRFTGDTDTIIATCFPNADVTQSTWNDMAVDVPTGATKFYLNTGNSAGTTVSTLEITIPSNEELENIRVAYNGTTYPTAGDAVRAQIQELHNSLNFDLKTITAEKTERAYSTGLVGAAITINTIDNPNYNYQKINVTGGDKLYCHFYPVGKQTFGRFTDDTDTIIATCFPNADVTQSTWNDMAVDVPTGATKFYLNTGNSAGTYIQHYEIDALGGVIKNSAFYGKKVSWFGDSIMANTWWQECSDEYNMESTNNGVGGSRISGDATDALWQDARIAAIPADVDIIFVGAGTNDWAQNVPIGDTNIIYNNSVIVESHDTFGQACHLLFKKLQTARPNARIIALGTPFGFYPNRSAFNNQYGIINNQNLGSLDYGKVLCDIAEQWGNIAFRYGEIMGINSLNAAALLDPGEAGHLHPTTDGAKERFRNALMSKLYQYMYI